MLKKFLQRLFAPTAERESVKHNWDVKFSILTQDHKQRQYTYQCRDCLKYKVLTESDILENADLAYKNEIENAPQH